MKVYIVTREWEDIEDRGKDILWVGVDQDSALDALDRAIHETDPTYTPYDFTVRVYEPGQSEDEARVLVLNQVPAKRADPGAADRLDTPFLNFIKRPDPVRARKVEWGFAPLPPIRVDDTIPAGQAWVYDEHGKRVGVIDGLPTDDDNALI